MSNFTCLKHKTQQFPEVRALFIPVENTLSLLAAESLTGLCLGSPGRAMAGVWGWHRCGCGCKHEAGVPEPARSAQNSQVYQNPAYPRCAKTSEVCQNQPGVPKTSLSRVCQNQPDVPKPARSARPTRNDKTCGQNQQLCQAQHIPGVLNPARSARTTRE